jgi:hypothetical protein
LPLALVLVFFSARPSATAVSAPPAPAAVSALPGESGAALTAADRERGQAVRHTGEAVSTAAPAEVPPPKRGVATHAEKPSQTTSQRDRSRVRAAEESRAGVARAIASAASGSAATHTTALPPPNA